jgi:hypothetical protein
MLEYEQQSKSVKHLELPKPMKKESIIENSEFSSKST